MPAAGSRQQTAGSWQKIFTAGRPLPAAGYQLPHERERHECQRFTAAEQAHEENVQPEPGPTEDTGAVDADTEEVTES